MTKHRQKQTRIPAALRQELTEYSSLLRALRTSQTLDVTAHLTQPGQDSDDDPDVPGPSESPPAASSSTEPGASTQLPSQNTTSPYWLNRDQWTRWPIPAEDVPKPDWSLRDEVEIIVKQALASPELSSESSPEAEESMVVKQEDNSEADVDNNSEDEEAYIQGLAESITPVLENQLESLFALISAHTVPRSASLQNRIEPFDWRDLVNILGSPAAAHLVDERILQTVITRMEELFKTTPASSSSSVLPPSPATAIKRHSLTLASQSRLNSLFSSHTASLFEQHPPPRGHKYLTTSKLRKAASKRKLKWKISNTDSEETDISEGKGKGKRRGSLVIDSNDVDDSNSDSSEAKD